MSAPRELEGNLMRTSRITLVVVAVLGGLLTFAQAAAAAIPDPGNGTAPPGFDKFVTILHWAAYIALTLCVLGLIMCGGTMAVQHRTGGGGGGGVYGQVGSVMVGCVLIGSASVIVAALT